jgi:hypothetical protein
MLSINMPKWAIALFVPIFIIFGCRENSIQTTQDNEFVSIAGNWQGAWSFEGVGELWSMDCDVEIINSGNQYTIKVNDFGESYGKHFDGIYNCSNYNKHITKYVKYLLIDINTGDSLYLQYNDEQIYGGILTSFYLISAKKEDRIFCFKN